MRRLTPKIWKAPHWKGCVQVSGLATILAKICAPDTHLELASKAISHSYRNHVWKESFGDILENWTPKEKLRVFASEIQPMVYFLIAQNVWINKLPHCRCQMLHQLPITSVPSSLGCDPMTTQKNATSLLPPTLRVYFSLSLSQIFWRRGKLGYSPRYSFMGLM